MKKQADPELEMEKGSPFRGLTQKQNQPAPVAGLLAAIYMVPEGKERAAMMEALMIFAWRAWQWDVVRLKSELDACKARMEESGSKLSCWVSAGSFEFELGPAGSRPSSF
jgi:hypothetical protein